MEPELRQFLAVIVVLLSLLVGTQLTLLWVSAVEVSVAFLLLVPLVFGALVSAAVWYAIRVVGPDLFAG